MGLEPKGLRKFGRVQARMPARHHSLMSATRCPLCGLGAYGWHAHPPEQPAEPAGVSFGVAGGLAGDPFLKSVA
jgi:hypothetical protein